jgi:ribosomal protein L7/L12
VTPSSSPPSTEPLPADVLAALQQGQTIEAIKRLRTATGLDLKDAKEAIDRHLAGASIPPRPSVAAAGTLPFAVSAALMKGNKLEAIRLLRQQGGLGLKEAKDTVEAFERENAATDPHRAPGEVPRTSGLLWLILVVVLAGLALLARHLFASPG